MRPIRAHISVAIADDHPMVIRGVENMLLDFPRITLDQVYINGKDLMEGLKKNTPLPDVLLLDLHMPKADGGEVLPEIVEKYPTVSVLIITNEEDAGKVQQIMDKGALGYLLKSTDQYTLVDAIIHVRDGKQYIDRLLKEPLLQHVISEKKRVAQRPTLSRREKEMLELIIKGYTNHEIATTLFLGQRTVETYRYNLMTKLNVKNTAALVRMAMEEQLLDE